MPSLLEEDSVRWVLTVPAIWKQQPSSSCPGGCLPSEACRQSVGVARRAGHGSIPSFIHHPWDQSPRVRTASPTLLGIFEGCICHQEGVGL